MTGPATLSYDEVAALIAKASGRDIHHHRLTEEQMTDRFVSFGVPAGFASWLAAMDTAIATGAEDRTTENVAKVTRRPAGTFQDFVTKNATAWAEPTN